MPGKVLSQKRPSELGSSIAPVTLYIEGFQPISGSPLLAEGFRQSHHPEHSPDMH